MAGDETSGHARQVSLGGNVRKLHRHALESIFGFCSIKEMHVMLAVNRAWGAAVVSMPSIRSLIAWRPWISCGGLREVDCVVTDSRSVCFLSGGVAAAR